MVHTVSVDVDEYVECIGFTAYAYLANKIGKRDLMKGSERSFGEFLEHFIRGKLAEVAFKKYLQEEHKIEALIDLDLPFWIRGEYLPDILALKRNNEWEPPNFWIEIKAVTARQRWMLLPTTSVTGSKRKQPRPYCAYINCQVDLPQDHVARLVKFTPTISARMSSEWQERLADLSEIEVTILGYVLFADVRNILKSDESAGKALNKVFGPENWRFLEKRKSFKDIQTGKRYGNFGRDNCVIRLSELRKDWKSLGNLLMKNEPLAPNRTRDKEAFEGQIEKSFELLSKDECKSWFNRTLKERATKPIDKW